MEPNLLTEIPFSLLHLVSCCLLSLHFLRWSLFPYICSPFSQHTHTHPPPPLSAKHFNSAFILKRGSGAMMPEKGWGWAPLVPDRWSAVVNSLTSVAEIIYSLAWGASQFVGPPHPPVTLNHAIPLAWIGLFFLHYWEWEVMTQWHSDPSKIIRDRTACLL